MNQHMTDLSDLSTLFAHAHAQEFDGWLYGNFENIREMTGRDLTFVYDDYVHVLRGHFRRGVMVSARRARIRPAQTARTHPLRKGWR